MYLGVVIILLVSLMVELLFLKRYNRDLFVDSFFIQKRSLFAIVLVAAISYFLPFHSGEWLSYLILIFVCPIYFSKRHLFFSQDTDAPEDYINTKDRTERWYLLFEGSRIFNTWLYILIVGTVIFHKCIGFLGWEMTEIDNMMAEAFFSTMIVAGLIYYSANKFSPEGFWRNVGFNKGGSRIRTVIIPIVLGLIFAGSSAYVVLTRDVHPTTPMSESLQTADTSGILILFFILALFVAPLFEEVVFRGYFFHIISRVFSQRMAIYSISLTFAALHVWQYWGDWMAILMVTLIGFALTMIRAWSGTTSASVITHYIYNIGVTVLPVIALVLSNPAYFEYEASFAKINAQQKEALLQRSIKERPDFADAYNALAWLLAEEQVRLDEALDLIDRALTLSPDNMMYLDTKAEIYEQQGNFIEEYDLRQYILENTSDSRMKKIQTERLKEIDLQIKGSAMPTRVRIGGP